MLHEDGAVSDEASAAGGGLGPSEPAFVPLDELARHREQIDDIDARLIRLLAERFDVTGQIGLLKAAAEIPPEDPEREAAHIARMRQLAADAGLNADMAERVLREVMAEVVRRHEEVAAARR